MVLAWGTKGSKPRPTGSSRTLAWLGERKRPLARHGVWAVVTVHKWRRAWLIKQVWPWETWLSNEERLPVLVRGWWAPPPGLWGVGQSRRLPKIPRVLWLEVSWAWKSLWTNARSGLILVRRHQRHLYWR